MEERDPIARLVERLWELKDGPITRMAERTGIVYVTLWRVMHSQRRPSGDTLGRLLGAYPELAALFAPADPPPGNAVDGE